MNPNAYDLPLSSDSDLGYILGVVEGDGCVWDSKAGYYIEIQVTDEEFAEKFYRRVDSYGLNPSISEREPRDSGGIKSKKKVFRVAACCKKLVEFYRSMDSKELFEFVREQRMTWSFIEGLYESDGSLKGGMTARITTMASEDYKKQLCNLLSSQGINANIQTNLVSIGRDDSEQFFENIECCIDRRCPND